MFSMENHGKATDKKTADKPSGVKSAFINTVLE